MSVQPSSLIFLVIVGIWAAYFVQYWVRRREHVATARSVDAFSETMRVLQRRAPLPGANLSTPAPRSYAVAPARAARPQVLVKRAEVVESDRTATASSTGRSTPMSTEPAPKTAELSPKAPLHHRPMQPSRATRGIVLLVGAATTPVFVLLGILGVLMSWAFVVPLAMAVGGFLWLRHGVQQEIAAKRAARAARAAARREAALPRTAAPAYAPLSATGDAPAYAAEHVDSKEAPTEFTAQADDDLADELAEVSTADELISTDTVVAADEPVQPTLLVDEDDVPLTWDPVPVPRPTYTMKARVERRPVATQEQLGVSVTEEPARDAHFDERGELTGS